MPFKYSQITEFQEVCTTILIIGIGLVLTILSTPGFWRRKLGSRAELSKKWWVILKILDWLRRLICARGHTSQITLLICLSLHSGAFIFRLRSRLTPSWRGRKRWRNNVALVRVGAFFFVILDKFLAYNSSENRASSTAYILFRFVTCKSVNITQVNPPHIIRRHHKI